MIVNRDKRQNTLKVKIIGDELIRNKIILNQSTHRQLSSCYGSMRPKEVENRMPPPLHSNADLMKTKLALVISRQTTRGFDSKQGNTSTIIGIVTSFDAPHHSSQHKQKNKRDILHFFVTRFFLSLLQQPCMTEDHSFNSFQESIRKTENNQFSGYGGLPWEVLGSAYELMETFLFFLLYLL